MTKMMTIKPVSEPTEWVNFRAIMEKTNSSLSICVDPHKLNKAI